MMVRPLFFRSLRSSAGLFGIILAVLALYGGTIIAMYDPDLGESLNMMANAMPELFAAFGMAGTPATLTDFLVNYLYGFLLIAFPMLLSILLAKRLVASYVDTGSVAYLLASPHARAALIATQAAVHLLACAASIAVFFAGCTVCCEAMFPGELDPEALGRVTLGLWALHLFLGGVVFASACVFNDAKYSVGVGTALVVAFFLVRMACQVSDAFEWLQYLTPMTLFAQDELAAGTGGVWQSCTLAGTGLALYLAGGAVFCRKDIPA